ncbi:hypothetical protein PR048_006468 [Dryococelus australis]|uniref:Uncharacterized protein n=1 Tax=Dryococelus australis TaxID=614101 RepID=A0ABQ9IB28_9NEOP|nr:hypothetical protein PR048_006468 [Dryococelus australis]
MQKWLPREGVPTGEYAPRFINTSEKLGPSHTTNDQKSGYARGNKYEQCMANLTLTVNLPIPYSTCARSRENRLPSQTEFLPADTTPASKYSRHCHTEELRHQIVQAFQQMKNDSGLLERICGSL